ncbi:hypothetical protein THOG05_90104 [Vibrio rotiferianus]|nr:hypothetical protein THOG05_90104 [Vibrio rotiferianus]CAH1584745.1 hypothetical protein THOE12_70221 [Vibrio rotiferianus]CAH1592772.1 hypothetical protein THOG10_60139 [Vibrio rotiferianus]CAH1593611.1 hypothetical protein THOB06_60139 [Vibrio rotiferianus]
MPGLDEQPTSNRLNNNENFIYRILSAFNPIVLLMKSYRHKRSIRWAKNHT